MEEGFIHTDTTEAGLLWDIGVIEIPSSWVVAIGHLASIFVFR